MITNLPTSVDFCQSGNELLNFAWDATSNLLTEFDQADYYGFDKSEVSDKYWAAARRTLTTSLTIVQQGVELILKGKICEISPYLLLSDPPSRWPSPYEGAPIDFSQFRTVDAQDLVRIYDTFSTARLSEEFSERFHSLREKRNAIMHTVGAGVSVQVTEVIEAILYMHKALFPSENWATTRREFLMNSPDSELGSGEYATNRACWEFSIVRELLEPAQIRYFMGVNKKQRAYLCPACLGDANTDAGFEFKLAVLRPKSPTATLVYCPVCDAEHQVIREDCAEDGCLGNVIAEDGGCCLTCGR
ncbi:hypothetical protein G9Q38_03675 [Pusillimonas sp. DMV24BSW_D]|uniref:hypothetical protein n=1 Tax=Neopusillimonas aestuarii TaxID=2716226 RepID=UPI00140D030F|nr:hypothetical protein [Pusillimonas sp. DMV24BSW_D]QIM48336.1 hypothetical protein G9Q38_03675 [Pusillimonas sp. DMV24BSW_D]